MSRIQGQKPQPPTEYHLCSSDQMRLLNCKCPPDLEALDSEITWCLTAFPPSLNPLHYLTTLPIV